MTVVKLVLGLLILVPSIGWAQTGTETFEFKASDIKSLNIHNSMGRVDIAASLTDKAGVVIEKTRWGNRCVTKVELVGNELTVISDDQNWILDTECRADFILSVPEETKTTIRVGLGNVNVTGVKGTLDLKIGSGSAKIQGDFKEIKSLTGQGGIEFTGTGDNMFFKSADGNILISYNEPPKAASMLNVNLGRGNVEVNLPDQATVFTTSMTGNGLVQNEFDQEKREHDLKITAYSRAGDIKILKK